MNGVLMACGAGMVRFRSVVIFLLHFLISPKLK